jgi:hypothetical protein
MNLLYHNLILGQVKESSSGMNIVIYFAQLQPVTLLVVIPDKNQWEE